MALESLTDDPGLAGQIAAQLATEIINGEIEAGERLLEVELAEQLGVSRTPVREALRLLETDAMVERLPRRGVRVTLISAEEAADLYLCRAYLYGLAAKITARTRTEPMVAELRALHTALQSSLEAQDRRAYLDLLTDFNDRLVECSGSKTILNALRPLRGKTLRLRYASVQIPKRVAESYEDYTRVLRAIERGDGEAAERSIRNAIASSASALLKHVFGVDPDAMRLNPTRLL